MTQRPNDEDLVRSALAGDTGAFDRLVERYAPRIFRMIRAQVRDASVAEDLVQETFLGAFIALPKFRFDASFFTWLYRIMVNTVGKHKRKGAHHSGLDAAHRQAVRSGSGWGLPGGVAPGGDALLEREETREQVRRALAELPEKYRTALLLREWAEHPYAQIAQVLKCPVGTVDSRIARARQMLAKRLNPDEEMR